MSNLKEEEKIEIKENASLNEQQESETLEVEEIQAAEENQEVVETLDAPVEEVKVETDSVKKKDNFFSRLIDKHRKKKEEKRKEIEDENASISSEESEKLNKKLDEVDKETKKVNSKKQKITSILLLLFNIALVVALLLWNLLGSDEFTPLNLLDIHILPLLIFVLFIELSVLFDVVSTHRMLYRKTYRSRWALAYKSVGILRYYDCVIPLSGGEAFAVSYLVNRDVPGATSLSIPVAKLIFQQISWNIVGIFCIIFSQTTYSSQFSGFVSATSIIGFILTFAAMAGVLFLSVSKNLGKKLVAWFTKILFKLHLIKDYDKQYQKYMKFISDYQEIIREYGKHPFEIILQMFFHGGRYILTYSIPFFIYCIFKGFPAVGAGELFSTFFISAALIELASSFIPLPGGSGMNEITFTVIFSQFLEGETFWALLLWRFATYYSYLIRGLAIVTYDTVYGNKKYKWVKKRMALQQESQIFKKQQIDSFRAERNKRRKREKSIKSLNK